MAKLYVQKFPTVKTFSGSQAASGSSSGSVLSGGYAQVIGMFWADAGSSFQIQQSSNSGTNWDLISDYAITACAASSFSIAVAGTAVKARFATGAGAASNMRGIVMLRPI
jgi:hypothetical protein